VILTDHPLRALNTFGIEARCAAFAEVASQEELCQVLEQASLRQAGLLVIGGGSNILFTRDFPGLVVRPALRGIEPLSEDASTVRVRARAGEDWHGLVSWAVERGLGGLENLALIPGTVGAAPIQNIGAYGAEVQETLEEVEAIEIESRRPLRLAAVDCAFGYRDSVFKRGLKGRLVITAATFRLSRNAPPNLRYAALAGELSRRGISRPGIRDVFEAVIRIRRAKLPDPARIGNAGSFFKNPVVSRAQADELRSRFPALVTFAGGDGASTKLAAGWLIEQAGWKGRRLGRCGVHDQQALVLVNHGGASGTEILELAERIREAVRDRFGIGLEHEVLVV
jgi:UDP-N-acetylmuramate dehydrogenase